MRRLNIRLLIILVAGVAVSGAIIQGLHAFQVRRHSGAFLREADRTEQLGHRQEAIDFLRKYLLLQPEDTQVMARLAKLLFDQSHFRESQAVLNQVLQRDQNNEDARRRLVDGSIRLRRYQDALYHLDKFLLKAHPDDGDLYFQRGTCQQGLGEYADAAQSFQIAITKSPALIAAYEQRTELLADRLGDRTRAVDVLNEMVKRNPKNSEAYVTRGRFIQAHGDDPLVGAAIRPSSAGQAAEPRHETLDQAYDDAKSALALAPSDLRSLLFAAEAAFAKGSMKEAREFAERVARQDPSNPETYRVLASLELREKRTKDAADLLTRGLRATHDAPVLLWTLASLRIQTNDIPEAKKLVDRLRPCAPARPITQYLSARILIAESKWADARHQLEVVGGDLKRWPQMHKESQFWLAQCYSRLGRDDLSVGAYRAALDIDSRWAPARFGLAEALRALGRIDEAVVELRQLRKLPDAPPQSSIMLLRLAVLKTLVSPSTERDWTAIDKELKEDLKKQPTAENLLLTAEVQVGKGEAAQAVGTLRIAMAAEPKEVRLWTALISLTSRLEHWEETERLLRDMRGGFGDSVAFRVAKAEYLIRRYGASRKDELRSLADPPPTFSPSDRLRLALPLGRLALAVQDYDLAQRLLRSVADAEPANLQIRLMLIDLVWQTGRVDDLTKPLAEIRRLEQNGPFWCYGEAVRLAILAKQNKDKAERSAEFEQSMRQLNEARARYPNWSQIPLLAAEIAEVNDVRGQRDRAIENYLEAIDLGERNPGVVSKLLNHLFDGKDYSRAESVIRKLQDEKVPFSTALTRFASEAWVQTGDFDRALVLARKSAAESHNVQDRIWLAQVLRISGRADEAKDEFEGATKADPKDASAWVALIQFYATTGQMDLAKKTLDEATTKIDPKQAPLAVAYGHQLVGQLQQAEAEYDAAAKAAPADFRARSMTIQLKLQRGQVKEAESSLREILASKEAASKPKNLAWARRELAMLLAAARTSPKYIEARTLIGKNLQDAPSSAVDLRVEALIDASFPTPDSQKRALETLAKLDERPGILTPDDRLILARLLSSRDWVKSKQVFQKVVTSSKNPRHIAAYVDALLNHQEELAAADDWLRHLEELAPRDLVTAELRLHFFVRSGRGAEALEEFDRLCERASAADMDQACMVCSALRTDDRQLLNRLERSIGHVAQQKPSSSVWVALAAIQDRMAQYDDAEVSYRRALALDRTKVEALNNLAYLLALRKKDLTEARSLVEKAIAQAGPRAAILDSRAVVELAAGKSDAALADSENAVSRDPSALHLFHQARGQLTSGKREAARDSFQNAIERGLTVAAIHPLEVATFQELKVQLEPPGH
jgi:tetratricopeptide (TPR) repeat protein